MKVVNFSETNSIINQYMAEIRDINYQQNRLLFRNNIERIGEMEAYEISKTLNYEEKDIPTPLGIAKVNQPANKIILGTIFRAGLPFHQGFLNIFDKAGAAFVSAYRQFTDSKKTGISVHVDYLAAPELNDTTLIIADPMLATGESMEVGYRAFLTRGKPKTVHLASVIGTKQGLQYLQKVMPYDNITIWCAAVDPKLNIHKYIVPGLGDAGDLCFGAKL